MYLVWSRLSLQHSGTLIASIHYSALLQLYCTLKQHRNKTRLRIGMKCVSADQVVGEGWRRLKRRGRCVPLSVHHILLIVLVLWLWIFPWSLIHAWNNVFTCSSCIMHVQGDDYSVMEDPLPTGPVFSFTLYVCLCTYLCVSLCEQNYIQPSCKIHLLSGPRTWKQWHIRQQMFDR